MRISYHTLSIALYCCVTRCELVRLDWLAPLGGSTRALWSIGVATEQKSERIVRTEPLCTPQTRAVVRNRTRGQRAASVRDSRS